MIISLTKQDFPTPPEPKTHNLYSDIGMCKCDETFDRCNNKSLLSLTTFVRFEMSALIMFRYSLLTEKKEREKRNPSIAKSKE